MHGQNHIKFELYYLNMFLFCLMYEAPKNLTAYWWICMKSGINILPSCFYHQ